MNVKMAVSVNKVTKDAEELFCKGLLCLESVISAIHSNFNLDIPTEIISVASGFDINMDNSNYPCGSISGGIIALGIFFGRTKQEASCTRKIIPLSKELRDWFTIYNNQNIYCCPTLNKKSNIFNNAKNNQCIHLTGLVAGKVAEIVIRDLDLINTDILEHA